ncbi:lantibiotic dehydratase [Epilithonimonas hominis]|uniref:lantibiotic dehydratase n=1 Tax=Epilithonimonas hominis TaxID=420404 RepID=UPI0028978CC0|nr:lantibiotic dehydratase [Epilithonimonas hominis]
MEDHISKKTKDMLKPTDFFLLRMPSFSVNDLMELNSYIQKKDIYLVKKVFNNDLFLKAIYLSSRYFYTVAVKWLENDKIPFNREDKILLTLYKYYSRISSRATPYGLFAGFSTGNISAENTQIEFNENYLEPKIRVDLLALKKIKDSIIDSDENLKKIHYFSNNTIYKLNNIIRYIEWDKNYNYSISEIETTILLDKILESSKVGISYQNLAQIIKNEENDASAEDIEDYIIFLFQNKILVDRLPPYLTDLNDPIAELQKQLETYKIVFEKSEIIKNMKEINSENIINIDKIESIYNKNKDFLNQKMQLLQVDLKLNLEKNQINKKIIQKIIQITDELSAIAINKPIEDINIFCRKFYEKYEEQEVELIKVLDPQLGIGYGLQISGNVEETPLLQNIFFSYKNQITYEVSSILKIVLNKYSDYFSVNNGQPIILTKEDIESAATHQKNNGFHDTHYLLGNLLVDNDEEINENNFKFFNTSSLPAPNFNTVLSRFAYHDEVLRSNIEGLQKDSDEVIYAEVVNSSSDRLGNVLLRPNFYQYEIPYISDTKGDKMKINIEDIMISIKNNKIILRSKSLNKRIKPIMSTAYNYRIDQLSIIRFLGDIQYYNIFRGFRWEWGALSDNIYLPRIEYREIILSEARWKINKNPYNISKLKAFLQKNKVPRYCNIKELDNVLLLDTENEISLTLLTSKLIKQDVVLYESFIESSFIRQKGKKYAGEVIIPLINEEKKDKMEITKPGILQCERHFYPGGEWSYFKLYCSHKIGDMVITEIIKPLLKELSDENSFIKWFFIRYNDPENHIRFRINKKLDKDLIQKLNEFAQRFIDEKLITKIQIDSYKREIERYINFGIEDAEKLFYFDSEAVAEFIVSSEFDGNENIRWMVSIASIDVLLDDFDISIQDRKNIFEELYQQFLPEFVDISNREYLKAFKASIDTQYRQYRYFFDEVINDKNLSNIENYMKPFAKRSFRIKQLLESKQISNENATHFLKNYIHMSLNRFFYTKPRMYELLIYFFLFQSYKSKFSRNGSGKKYAK